MDPVTGSSVDSPAGWEYPTSVGGGGEKRTEQKLCSQRKVVQLLRRALRGHERPKLAWSRPLGRVPAVNVQPPASEPGRTACTQYASGDGQADGESYKGRTAEMAIVLRRKHHHQDTLVRSGLASPGSPRILLGGGMPTGQGESRLAAATGAEV